MKLSSELQRYQEIDARLVDAARPIKILSVLTWPAHLADAFLESWRRGNPVLPVVEYPAIDWSERREALARIVQDCDAEHPIGRYISQTASSYIVAARMLENIGTADFRAMSELLYGSPQDRLGRLSNLDLAIDFIRITTDFAHVAEDGLKTECILPETVADELKAQADAFFTRHRIEVVVDHGLAAKAAAGSERVRIRGMTGFTRNEIEQLREHELFVHSATMLNGRSQPYLKSLGLGAPRTTCAQEGIATFAEMITNTMDLARLRRIALRIKAIHMAQEGGSFIDIFRYFVEAGQSPQESFQSAARIFRGGDVRGRHVFTKDVVYLKGLFAVHTFLRKAIELRKVDYPRFLFVGRLALGDVVSLEEFIKSGYISSPLYEPRWLASRDSLTAYLSYSAFTNRLRLSEVRLGDFVDDPLWEELPDIA